MLPSTVIRLDDGTPIAWAFLGKLLDESQCSKIDGEQDLMGL